MVFNQTTGGANPSGFEGVYYVAQGGQLWNYNWTPLTSWTAYPLSGGPAAGTGQSPATSYDPLSGDETVYYLGAEGQQWNYHWTSVTSWTASIAGTAGEAETAGSSPSVIDSPAGAGPEPAGFTAAYYPGQDGHIWNYNWTPNSGWSAYALPGGGVAAAPGSSPAAVINQTATGPNPAGFQAVYYAGTDGHIWNYNWTPANGWGAYALPGGGAAPAAKTSPVVVYSPGGTGPNPPGFTAVYYVGVEGRIWNYTWTPSTGWGAYPLPGGGASVAPGTSPSVVVNETATGPNPAGFEAVYYVGVEGRIWNYNWTPSTGWGAYALPGGGVAAAAKTSPAAVYSPGGTESNPAGFEAVYYVGTDGHIWNYNWTPAAGWGAYALPGGGSAPEADTSPSVVFNQTTGGANPSGFEGVYYVAQGGQLWNYNWTPSTSWTAYPLSGGEPAADTPATIYDGATGKTGVYYSDTPGQLWSWSWTELASWLAGPL